jgi:hypothetical protein
MKTYLIYILLLSFLLQSCYTYKPIYVSKENLVKGKKYKIRTNDKMVNVTFLSSNDTVGNFKIAKEEKQIVLSEIKQISVRTFSSDKTAILIVPFAILLVVYILLKDLSLPYGS